jgi:hypothetical protein
MDDTINVVVVENPTIPNKFSFEYISNLLMQNKTYLLIGIIILAALGYYIYITYFNKKKINKNVRSIPIDDSDDEVVIKKKPIKREKKVIIHESEDSEPDHLANLDLTQSELNNINNSLEK